MSESNSEFRRRPLSRKLKVSLVTAGLICLLFWGVWLPEMGPTQIYPKLVVTWLYMFWLFKVLHSHGVSSKSILLRFLFGGVVLYLSYLVLYIGILSTATLVGIFGK